MGMSYHSSKNCEKCEFRVEQVDITGETVNMCLILQKPVGLLETCERYNEKTGEHITKEVDKNL